LFNKMDEGPRDIIAGDLRQAQPSLEARLSYANRIHR